MKRCPRVLPPCRGHVSNSGLVHDPARTLRQCHLRRRDEMYTYDFAGKGLGPAEIPEVVGWDVAADLEQAGDSLGVLKSLEGQMGEGWAARLRGGFRGGCRWLRGRRSSPGSQRVMNPAMSVLRDEEYGGSCD